MSEWNDFEEEEDELADEDIGQCPECGNDVYADSESCPVCGHWFTDADQSRMWRAVSENESLSVMGGIVFAFFAFVVLLAVVGALLFSSN